MQECVKQDSNDHNNYGIISLSMPTLTRYNASDMQNGDDNLLTKKVSHYVWSIYLVSMTMQCFIVMILKFWCKVLYEDYNITKDVSDRRVNSFTLTMIV